MTSLKTSTEHLSLENMDPEKSALRFYVFVRLKLGDGAKKKSLKIFILFSGTLAFVKPQFTIGLVNLVVKRRL